MNTLFSVVFFKGKPPSVDTNCTVDLRNHPYVHSSVYAISRFSGITAR